LLGHPDQRARMGEAGRRHVAQYFSVDAMLSGNLAVYNSILQTPTDDRQ
jgi:spore maturation protein CgeB